MLFVFSQEWFWPRLGGSLVAKLQWDEGADHKDSNWGDISLPTNQPALLSSRDQLTGSSRPKPGPKKYENAPIHFHTLVQLSCRFNYFFVVSIKIHFFFQKWGKVKFLCQGNAALLLSRLTVKKKFSRVQVHTCHHKGNFHPTVVNAVGFKEKDILSELSFEHTNDSSPCFRQA